MSLKECSQRQPATGDLRSQVQALLAASHPPREQGVPSRRRTHPLYRASGGSGGGSAASNQQGSRADVPAGRCCSQSPSPPGISKARSERSASDQGSVRVNSSAVTSPAQQVVRQQDPGCTAPRQLDFGARFLNASCWPGSVARGKLSTQETQVEGQQSGSTPSDPLPDFARLCIASPASSPWGSPAGPQTRAPSPRQQQQHEASTPGASQLGADSQWRWHQLRQQAEQVGSPLLESPIPPTPLGSGSCDENSWSVAPSPPSQAPSAQRAARGPDICCPQQPRASPAQQLAPAPSGAQAGAAGSPSSPFSSSQERRQEIEILMEMAAHAGAWSSQEEDPTQPALPCQPAWQHQQPMARQERAGDGPPWAPPLQQPCQRCDGDTVPAPSEAGHSAAAAAAPAAPACGGVPGVQGAQRGYTCSLTQQELPELPDPCSQPEGGDAQEQQAQQQQQQQETQPPQVAPQQGRGAAMQAGAGSTPSLRQGEQQQQQRRQQHRQQQQQQQQQSLCAGQPTGQPAPGSPGPPQAAVLRQRYPAQGVGLGQWAAVGESRESAEAEAARRQREAAEDALVATACALPQLHGALHNSPSQREAFAAADELNRPMPRLRPPQIILSAVPIEQLLPSSSFGTHTGGAAPREPAHQQQRPAGSSSGGDGSVTTHLDRAGCAPCEADSAGAPPPPQLQQPQRERREGQQPLDFLSRCAEGALPAPGSGGYLAFSSTPLLPKRQREEADEERQQREQRQAARAQEYQALLRTHREEVVAAAQRQQVQQQQAQRQQAQRQQQAAAAPAAVACAGLAAEAPQEGLWHEEAVRTFCVERRGRGGVYYRSFTAASYPAVWAAFRRTRCEARHWYEVVREGRPAHLYFDLEFDPRLNPRADGDVLVDRLLARVAEQLRHHFSLSPDPRCIYELDSSTPAKFSRHLTVRLPGHAFATNHAMGKFVAQVLAASGDELLVVRGDKDGDPLRGSFVDTAVYSKNRHWRMSFCCKGGKAAVLAPTRRYATAPGATTSTAHVFLDTLVCNVAPRARLLQMPDPLPMGSHSVRGGFGATAGGGTAVAAAATVCGDGAHRHVAWKRDAGEAALPWGHMQELQRLAEAALPFIERAALQRAGGAPARARTLAFCGAGATVAYSMIGPGSHHCENVGRPHASNHVFFVADLVKGAYAQKCHDPDCARFRSGWMPLPPELCLPEGRAVAMGLAALQPPSGSRRSGSSC